tara:strand:+ start:91 stop:390 length:300 start_codon:yes stop_codon:yes gene_type:complete
MANTNNQLTNPISFWKYVNDKAINVKSSEEADQVFMLPEGFRVKDGKTLSDDAMLDRMNAYKDSINFMGKLKPASNEEYGYTAYKNADSIERHAIPSGI